MKRRSFIKTTTLAGLAVGLGACYQKPKTHILTLSFDDGFKKSFYKIADIHEKFGLKACLNIIASAHTWENDVPNEYHSAPVGDFNDWNALQKRGHEIMPHSWTHDNLTEIHFEKAQERITKCLDYFEKHLEGFKSYTAIYNFAFNASTLELEQFALSRVRAIRTGAWNILGDKQANPLPTANGPFRMGCWSYGPDNADSWVEEQVNQFLDSTGGWLILNLHGLDEEGWGPISSTFLNSLLKRLSKINYLDILPAGEVLKRRTN